MTTFLVHPDWDEACFRAVPHRHRWVILDQGEVCIVWGSIDDATVMPAPGLRLFRVQEPIWAEAKRLEVFWAEGDSGGKAIRYLVFGLVHFVREQRHNGQIDWEGFFPMLIGVPSLPVEQVTETHIHSPAECG